jgi:TRAP-type transport system small permease protein
VIERLLNGYYRLLQVLLTLLMTALILPVTMQILSRYTGMIPRYIWTEEIARFCFIWIVMIGAMIAVRGGTHLDVDVLPKASHKVEAGLRIFVHVAMLLAALIFVTYGYQFAQFGAIQTSEISGLPTRQFGVRPGESGRGGRELGPQRPEHRPQPGAADHRASAEARIFAGIGAAGRLALLGGSGP